jgi:hypothetical protein
MKKERRKYLGIGRFLVGGAFWRGHQDTRTLNGPKPVGDRERKVKKIDGK